MKRYGLKNSKSRSFSTTRVLYSDNPDFNSDLMERSNKAFDTEQYSEEKDKDITGMNTNQLKSYLEENAGTIKRLRVDHRDSKHSLDSFKLTLRDGINTIFDRITHSERRAITSEIRKLTTREKERASYEGISNDDYNKDFSPETAYSINTFYKERYTVQSLMEKHPDKIGKNRSEL